MSITSPPGDFGSAADQSTDGHGNISESKGKGPGRSLETGCSLYLPHSLQKTFCDITTLYPLTLSTWPSIFSNKGSNTYRIQSNQWLTFLRRNTEGKIRGTGEIQRAISLVFSIRKPGEPIKHSFLVWWKEASRLITGKEYAGPTHTQYPPLQEAKPAAETCASANEWSLSSYVNCREFAKKQIRDITPLRTTKGTLVQTFIHIASHHFTA